MTKRELTRKLLGDETKTNKRGHRAMMAGMYGERTTFEDARITVTKFLDDFYDERDGINQAFLNLDEAFLNLERRLQAYFCYEPRDTENKSGRDRNGGDT